MYSNLTISIKYVKYSTLISPLYYFPQMTHKADRNRHFKGKENLF